MMRATDSEHGGGNKNVPTPLSSTTTTTTIMSTVLSSSPFTTVSTMSAWWSLLVLILVLLPWNASTFQVVPRGMAAPHTTQRIMGTLSTPVPSWTTMTTTTTTTTAMSSSCLLASFKYQTPTPDEAADMGVRDWPQQVKSGKWVEEIPTDVTVIRYVLDGTGQVTYSPENDDDNDASKSAKTLTVGPGSMVEVTGTAQLSWMSDQGKDMILLTPNYEEGGTLLIVAAALIVLTGVLVVGLS